MLTYNEQFWLAWKKRISRMKNVSAAWCHNCPQHGRNAAGCYGEPYCPLFPDLQDALEFEGRVAAKLAQAYAKIIDAEFDMEIRLICEACPATGRCNMDCCDSILKWSRLQVEEEMDGQG